MTEEYGPAFGQGDSEALPDEPGEGEFNLHPILVEKNPRLPTEETNIPADREDGDKKGDADPPFKVLWPVLRDDNDTRD
jgi:hypothetical protein